MDAETTPFVNASILIVDDTRDSLRLLTEILSRQGYAVRPALNGALALSSARAAPPDLILLDIMMPQMSGYEVCEHLKADAQTRDIPIIFISALTEVFDKVKAFALGGVDYITKPFEPEEVVARVRLHLTLRMLQATLQVRNAQLQQEVSERKQVETALRQSEQQLRELNASKDTFFSIIAHDLRGPLSSLKELTQIAEDRLESYSADKLREIIFIQRKTVVNLSRLLENLLTWSRIQRGLLVYQPERIDLAELAAQNIALFALMAQQKQILLRHALRAQTIVCADRDMIDTVLRNLILNALKFTHPGGTIELSARQTEDGIEVAVADTGIGIAPEHLPKLFRIDVKYKRLGTAHEKGTGLGLILCKELVEQNGGWIWIESAVEKGTTVRFTLPQ